MTLAIFLPLVLAAIAITDLIIFRTMLSKSAISERLFTWIALASILLPLVAFILLRFVVPDVGAIELF